MIAALFIACIAHSAPPERMGAWDVVPDVVVHPKQATPVARVVEAVDWWRARGHNLGDVRVVTLDDPLAGMILITPEPPSQDWMLAETEARYLLLAGRMSRAEIRSDRALSTRQVVHELGHALGFEHCETPGHPMHASRAGLRRWHTELEAAR